jgi:hypothetical protein
MWQEAQRITTVTAEVAAEDASVSPTAAPSGQWSQEGDTGAEGGDKCDRQPSKCVG